MSFNFNLNKEIRVGVFSLIFLLRVKIKNKANTINTLLY